MSALQDAPALSALSTQPVVEARDLKRVYEIRRGFMRAPDHLQALSLIHI